MKLFISSPCFGGMVTTSFMQGYADLALHCYATGIDTQSLFISHQALITAARNTIVAQFLDSDATHLLMIDADIEFRAKDVQRLIDFDHDVAVIPYRKKKEEVDFTIRWIDPEHIPIKNQFAQVETGPTGFMLIRREVFEKMKCAYPDLKYKHDENSYKTDNAYLFFDTMHDKESGLYFSEDFAFCKRWGAIGGEIWADCETALTHIGQKGYKGALKEAFRG